MQTLPSTLSPVPALFDVPVQKKGHVDCIEAVSKSSWGVLGLLGPRSGCLKQASFGFRREATWGRKASAKDSQELFCSQAPTKANVRS